MRCEHALPLIPRYVDGELSKEQAQDLRAHLVDCHSCRVQVQEAEALSSWFVDPEPLVGPAEAPDDFAARVTALAFAGQTAPAAPAVGPRSLETARMEERLGREGSLMGFVLNLTAAAAILVIFLAFGIERRSLPEVNELRADSLSKPAALELLDELNAQDEQDDSAEEGQESDQQR